MVMQKTLVHKGTSPEIQTPVVQVGLGNFGLQKTMGSMIVIILHLVLKLNSKQFFSQLGMKCKGSESKGKIL